MWSPSEWNLALPNRGRDFSYAWRYTQVLSRTFIFSCVFVLGTFGWVDSIGLWGGVCWARASNQNQQLLFVGFFHLQDFFWKDSVLQLNWSYREIPTNDYPVQEERCRHYFSAEDDCRALLQCRAMSLPVMTSLGPDTLPPTWVKEVTCRRCLIFRTLDVLPLSWCPEPWFSHPHCGLGSSLKQCSCPQNKAYRLPRSCFYQSLD